MSSSQPVRKRGRPISTGARVRGRPRVRGGGSGQSKKPQPIKVDFYAFGATTPNESESEDCFSSEFWSDSSLSCSKDYLSGFETFPSNETVVPNFSSSCISYDEKVFWDPFSDVPEVQEEFVCESTVYGEEPSTSNWASLSDIKVECPDSGSNYIPESSCKSYPTGDLFAIKQEVIEDIKNEPEEEDKETVNQPRLKHISAYEEFQLMKRLEHATSVLEDSTQARRLYRKLSLRHDRRTKRLPQFDFDKLVRRLGGESELESERNDVNGEKRSDDRILDRFQAKSASASHCRQHTSFKSRLVGCDESGESTFFSPYTRKQLKTIIWRDHDARPLKLRLLQDILSAPLNKGKRGGDHPCSVIPEKAPVGCIEYHYVRPHHIPAINSLAREFFWPGVDTSDCLQYPDFTCVALYKKIVVGFAVMVPDVGFNETYISFLFTHPEWRGAGIAKFMVYHLIQTSLGKDITLHVEATNPAVFLYQKFCFKFEEFLVDFYDKYLPANSTQCKHALFMRLSR